LIVINTRTLFYVRTTEDLWLSVGARRGKHSDSDRFVYSGLLASVVVDELTNLEYDSIAR